LDSDFEDENQGAVRFGDPVNECGGYHVGDRRQRERLAVGHGEKARFPSQAGRCRFVSSVREVVDAEGTQVISNEIYAPGPGRRATIAAPLRPTTAGDLTRFGYLAAGQIVRGLPA
jgi:hypothetical protein